jgi:GNAT superfamily N-acetyltransferase
MNVFIRTAQIQDMPEVLKLIKQLAIFENEPDAVEITVKDLERDGFGEIPQFNCFVAEVEGAIEGIALLYNRYSTWKGRVIHLEDLIVNKAKRGHGIGTKLLDEVIRYGYNRGVKRIHWEVLNWNAPAIAFYEKNGATIMRDWNVVQMDSVGIKNYVSKL